MSTAYARSLERIQIKDLPTGYQLKTGTKTRDMKFDNANFQTMDRQVIMLTNELAEGEVVLQTLQGKAVIRIMQPQAQPIPQGLPLPTYKTNANKPRLPNAYAPVNGETAGRATARMQAWTTDMSQYIQNMHTWEALPPEPPAHPIPGAPQPEIRIIDINSDLGKYVQQAVKKIAYQVIKYCSEGLLQEPTLRTMTRTNNLGTLDGALFWQELCELFQGKREPALQDLATAWEVLRPGKSLSNYLNALQELVERFDVQGAPLTDREITRKIKADLRGDANAQGYKLMIEEIRIAKASRAQVEPTGRALLAGMYSTLKLTTDNEGDYDRDLDESAPRSQSGLFNIGTGYSYQTRGNTSSRGRGRGARGGYRAQWSSREQIDRARPSNTP